MTAYPGPPTGRLHETSEGRHLTIERSFPAPISDVWASFTEADLLARWYGSIDGDLLAGQSVMVTMSAEEGAPAEPVRILECEPPNRFLVETDGMGEPWRLEVELVETNGTTDMTFTHHLIGDLEAGDIGPGWEFYADRHHAAFHGNELPDWTADRYQEILGPHYVSGA